MIGIDFYNYTDNNCAEDQKASTKKRKLNFKIPVSQLNRICFVFQLLILWRMYKGWEGKGSGGDGRVRVVEGMGG